MLSVVGHSPIRFRTKKFGVGRRGAKSAALARFAACAGFGDAEELFKFLSGLPLDTTGVLFTEAQANIEIEEPSAPQLRCVWSDEAVA